MIWKKIVAAIIILPIVLVVAWTWLALSFSYANGERAGYLQKFSEKGWIFKTWEGELAMANLPGTMPEIFYFTVRDPQIANQVRHAIGERISISYSQHRGIPTKAFGDTEYFITAVTVLGGAPPPPPAPTK